MSVPLVPTLVIVRAHVVRDLRRYLRSPLVIVGTVAGPVLLLLAIGLGLGSTVGGASGEEIKDLVVPGLMVMGALLAASAQSVELSFDVRSGLVEATLVGRARPWMVVVGRAVSSTASGFAQAVVVGLLAIALGIGRVPEHPVLTLGAVLLFAAMAAAGSNWLALVARRPGAIQALLNLVVNPLFFLGGALFAVDAAPTALRALATVNPVYYGVRAVQAAYDPAGSISATAAVVSVAVMVGVVVATVVASARALVNR